MGIFNKKIGLALGSGGARGLAHIGVLKELERNNIKIDCIAGSSIGALIGGIYAATKNTAILEEMASNIDSKEYSKMFSDYSLNGGLVKGDKIFELIDRYIPSDMLIQDTLIPFCAVTSELNTGRRFVIKEGNLKKAMRASISIPLLFEPVEWNGKHLVDGGITEAVPTQTVKEMGVDKVIAVNLYAGDFQEELNLDKKKVIEIARRSMSIALEEIARRDLQLADISLNPMIGNIPLSTIGEDPTPYIQIGEEVVKSHLKEIKKL